MPKTILASLTGFSSDRTVLEAAVAAARIDGGHIQCFHTRIDAVETAAPTSFVSPHRTENLHGLLQAIASQEEERSRHARQAVDEIRKRHAIVLGDAPAERAPISIAWREEVSFLNETLREARYHDLTVMARDEELSSERLLSVLMQSGRPLLIAPEKPVEVVGKKVAIAWKATAEAARALTAASFILSRAEKVVILSVSENKAGDDSDRFSAEHLARQLAWQGIAAEVRMRYSPSVSTSRALLDMAYDGDADLLVMGAFGHNRIREFVFGGVTRDLLAASALPVFMIR
ncbi:MAG TPA: universal stress protein [Rhizomicrobium sp.]|nr:universal stress protein [Rhizomicrobium sp.]